AATIQSPGPVLPAGPKKSHVSNPTKPARICCQEMADFNTSSLKIPPVQACSSVFQASFPKAEALPTNCEIDPLPPVLCVAAISNPFCSPFAELTAFNQFTPFCTLHDDGAIKSGISTPASRYVGRLSLIYLV